MVKRFFCPWPPLRASASPGDIIPQRRAKSSRNAERDRIDFPPASALWWVSRRVGIGATPSICSSRPKGPFSTRPCRYQPFAWTAVKGHQERFPPPRLSGGCGFQSGPLLPTIRPCKLLGPALSHVRCYVPRNTTRASTAFTP